MKKALFLFALIVGMLTTACNDDPKITFFDHSGTYTIGSDMALNVNINGFSVTDKDSSVIFQSDDNRIATISLIKIVPDYGMVTVGGVEVTPAPSGNGILFAGKYAVSDTEMIVFKGSIADGTMTIDIQTVPIPATTT